jgi:hypothetical protein
VFVHGVGVNGDLWRAVAPPLARERRCIAPASCDAFEKFPPTPQRYLEVTARSRALMWLAGWTVRFRFVQRLPTAYGWVTQRPIDPVIMRSYITPIRTLPGVRRDLQRLLLAVDTR